MRYLSGVLEQFSGEKFVFLSGPRQVGKTTLAKEWLSKASGDYLNWDIAPDRKKILALFRTNESSTPRLVLDEVHKHPKWKRALKGLYDGRFPSLHAVVTGSARLDLYQRGGDSLLGRYERLRLHPFSIGEISRMPEGKTVIPPPEGKQGWLQLASMAPGAPELEKSWRRLETYSGFPEPFMKQNLLGRQRWTDRRRELVLREDLRDLTAVRSLAQVEELALLLPERVGKPLSINSLREDLEVAFDTVKAWIGMLERLYYCYRLPAFTAKLNRSLHKDRKIYLWDWAEVEDPGARFENMVAGHLLKAVHYWSDLGFGDYDLCYWRDREKREVDFVVTRKGKPVLALECKHSDSTPAAALIRFGQKWPETALIQLVNTAMPRRFFPGGCMATAWEYLAPLV